MNRLPVPSVISAGRLAAGMVLSVLQICGAEEADPARFRDQARPVLKELCAGCHNPEKLKGDFDLLPLLEKDRLTAHRAQWEKVADAIRERDMPPENKPQPSEAQREALVRLIEEQLSHADPGEAANPGKVTLRRLNREEYRNTVRDLLLVDYQPDDFPNDEVGYGFDNIADVLSLPPLLMEKFMAAAEAIARRVIVLEPVATPRVSRLRGDRFTSAQDWIKALENHDLGLYREGEAVCAFDFPATGEYTLRLRAHGDQAGPEAPKLALRVGGRQLQVFSVTAKGRAATYEVRAPLEAGRQEIGLSFLNNYNDTRSADPKLRGDRNVYVESLEIISPPMVPPPPGRGVPLEQFHGGDGVSSRPGDGEILFFANAEVAATVAVPKTDEYLVRVRARGEPAGGERPKLRLAIGGREVKTWDVTAGKDGEETLEARLPMQAGQQRLSLGFLNDYYEPNHPDPAKRGDRNLWVRGVEMVGPLSAGATDLPESHRRLIPKMPAPGGEIAAAREILGRLAGRAYRRPVSAAEAGRLAGLVETVMKEGGSFLEGMQVALQAVLCSPQFLFRWELDPPAARPGAVRALDDYEVASRLSYFLWSSLPDDELFALAGSGQLLKDGNLEKQALRMLADPKARAFVANFAGQWLQIRSLAELSVDPDAFPRWDNSLKAAMREESERFFEAVMRENRPVTELLDADFTFLNEKLARFYGIPGVQGDQFQRVSLPAGSVRGGVLTQGSVLLATATPTRTSPVIRGKWILEQILGTPPPPPPPNVPPLPDQGSARQSASLRQRLEAHRSQAECAGCHSLMDPLGFALENFDATGAWREKDGAFPIDASGQLRGAKSVKFNGPKELKTVLKGQKNFTKCFAEKMLTYALGRGLEYYDRPAINAIIGRLHGGGDRFHELVLGIVASEPFLKRKGGMD